MTKDILMQYINLKEEIKDLQRRKFKTNKQINKIKKEGTVIDAVKGTRKDGTFGSIRIEGFPYPKYDAHILRLSEYMTTLEQKELELLEITIEVEKYIDAINDSRMRRIVRLRVIDDLSWVAVANKMGGGNTEDGVRMAFNRFLDNNKSCSVCSLLE